MDVPKPVIRDVKPGEPVPAAAEAPLLTSEPTADDKAENAENSATFPAFFSQETPVSESAVGAQAGAGENSSAPLDFGFSDTLDMDLGGFQNVGAERSHGEQEWGNLGNLMGEESKDISVAPALDEASAAQQEGMTDQQLPSTEHEIQEIARQAEGQVAVPTPLDHSSMALGEAEISADASGVPTEEVNEQPQTDLPPAVEENSNGPLESAEAAQFDYSFDFQPPATESDSAEQNEQSVFSYSLPDATEGNTEPTPGYEAPQHVDIPSETTVEPAKEASEESKSTGILENEAPDVDAV